MKRNPSILDYLHAPPGTYPTIDNPMPRGPIELPQRHWAQGPAPQYLTPPIDTAPDQYAPPPILGPGGITNSAPFEGGRLPHVSLASVLAPPAAMPQTPPSAPIGLLPGMNPGGIKNDAGVGVADAAQPPVARPGDFPSGDPRGGALAYNSAHPLRLPQHVQPGQASQASVNAVRGYGSVGDPSWWLRLLGY